KNFVRRCSYQRGGERTKSCWSNETFASLESEIRGLFVFLLFTLYKRHMPEPLSPNFKMIFHLNPMHRYLRQYALHAKKLVQENRILSTPDPKLEKSLSDNNVNLEKEFYCSETYIHPRFRSYVLKHLQFSVWSISKACGPESSFPCRWKFVCCTPDALHIR
ncbi:hypothetical protein L9F63_021363, partial [Diploptera punctata]